MSRPGWIGDRRFGVATKVFGSRQGCSVRRTEAGRDLVLRSRLGFVGFEVATSFLRSRHGWHWGRSRPGFLVSRPGNPTVGRNEVAT